MKLLSAFLILSGLAWADVFLNNPRGTNNKGGDDDNQAVENANRLFDSSNQADGGTHSAPTMYYYEGSLLQVSWVSNNGCGKNGETHCEFVLQYMCDPLLRDGTTSQTIPNTEASDTDTTYGRHESYEYYQMCSQRQRNKGLFLADTFLILDSTMDHETATYTRQTCWPGIDCNVNRHGFECPEERDYYPYWHPTPWRDIAVFVDDLTAPHPYDSTKTICDYYKAESQNIRNRGWCEGDWAQNNRISCESGNGVWQGGQGGFGIAAPDCVENKPMRANHLGSGPDGFEHQYMWTVPNVGALPSELASAGGIVDMDVAEIYKHCAMRIRLNITSDDYPRWTTFADKNSEPNQPRFITSEENVAMPCPTSYPYAGNNTGTCFRNLSVAAATPMLGMVFQDRTWEFEIRRRPTTVQNRIHNLNVIGRRGNIVQTYPSVEYDFRPNELEMIEGEWLHPQWTGSDNNPANQAGEGRDETDRSNIVQIAALTDNHPVRFQDQTLFATTFQAQRHAFADSLDRSCRTLGELLTNNENDDEIDEDVQNCGKLNADYVGYFDGDLQKMSTPGTYYYMSSRNNNYTNRSQKGVITVKSCTGSGCPVNDFINYVPGDRFKSGEVADSAHAGRLLAGLATMLL
jgi:hypothetical protein